MKRSIPPAILKSLMVMPSAWKMNWPTAAKTRRITVAMPTESLTIMARCS